MEQTYDDCRTLHMQRKDINQTWPRLREDVRALMAERRSYAQRGAIDAQKVRQRQERFARASEYLGDFCEYLKAEAEELNDLVQADGRQRRAAPDSGSSAARLHRSATGARNVRIPPSTLLEPPKCQGGAVAAPSARPLCARAQAPRSTSRLADATPRPRGRPTSAHIFQP